LAAAQRDAPRQRAQREAGRAPHASQRALDSGAAHEESVVTSLLCISRQKFEVRPRVERTTACALEISPHLPRESDCAPSAARLLP
jgi:hypothetical protein